MDAVRDLLTERAVLGLIASLAVLGLFVMLCRARRVSTSVEDAVMDMLHRMSKASADLREGLTEDAANKATPHLREMLRCVAVGITDHEGTLLSWDGGANDHYEFLRTYIERAIGEGHKEHVEHRKLDCELPGPCSLHTAVIVPLVVENEVAGTLIVVSGVANKRQIRMAEETARFVSTQLELEVLQKSRQALAQAEVRALRAQISPHFVYNALNTISSLIRTDPAHARELLQEFAEFTRYSFRTDGFFTTLSDELKNIHRYLTIEQARYGPRLNVRLKVAPEVLQVVLPFLVLQPLVENAVRHGLAKKPGGGELTIIAEDNGAEALISVEDDGVGMDPDRLFEDLKDAHQTGAHVGIGNINHRMRAVFGDDYALVVETAPDAGMKIILKIPKYRPGVRTNLPIVPPRLEDTTEQPVVRA
ncbi:two-component system LytT family sensor kinase [Saccharothrix ecbatanensis]|jgi:two-component system LytT family sensor kinase|uniref:Two-component system LytT family sensor kinase n=1 Tax=Saccharothrix ecbatanensis TaxID=1105145 RepID=A0A7W9HR32_9PSEU|nr:histidine kinase [Saccharothrix ecbatanensis]MBB5806883.1 two-component system LytT family sensor kinase [Saccharothrix ecbatanensis]